MMPRHLSSSAAAFAVGVVLACALLCAPSFASDEVAAVLPVEGDVLPAFSLAAPAYAGDAESLGVSPGASFSLADLGARGAKLIIYEVIGVYCAQCVKQAPKMNNLHNRLQRKKLLGEVVMLAHAAGGTSNEAAMLRKQGRYVYPVVADADYAVHKLLAEPKTPYTMLLTPDGKVLWAHLGVIEDIDSFYSRVVALAKNPS